MEESLSQEVLLIGDYIMMFSNNENDGILLANAFGNMMADNTFRQIMGYKLLSDENRVNDGIGMALLLNNPNPINSHMIQPMTLNGIYRKNY